MSVLAISLALAAHVFPWSCGQYQPHVPVRFVDVAPHLGHADFAGWPRCEIRLDGDWKRLSPGMKCSILVHERGHTAGYMHPVGQLERDRDGVVRRHREHSPNPRSVMHNPPGGWRTDKRCRRALRRARAPGYGRGAICAIRPRVRPVTLAACACVMPAASAASSALLRASRAASARCAARRYARSARLRSSIVAPLSIIQPSRLGV